MTLFVFLAQLYQQLQSKYNKEEVSTVIHESRVKSSVVQIEYPGQIKYDSVI